MANHEFVLTLEQRDAIMRALRAIERQVGRMAGECDWQGRYVVGTNVSIIQANLTNLPLAGEPVGR